MILRPPDLLVQVRPVRFGHALADARFGEDVGGPRAGLEEPISETAFSVYTALINSPDIGGRASVGRPSGLSIKLAVWAVYPNRDLGVNWTKRLKGETPLTVCMPGEEDQSLHGFDETTGKWVELESVESERDGHICGLHTHDLGLIVVSGN